MTKARTGTKKKPGAGSTARPAARPTDRTSDRTSDRPSNRSPDARPDRAPARSGGKPSSRAARTAPAGEAAAPAETAAAPRPARKVEAAKPFQREYRKWLERLISLRQQLVIDGERLGEEGLKALEQEVSVDHMADFGSDSYEQDTTLSLIENKSEALRDVDEAIRRIEAKTYGLCEECEQMIPAGRLEVIPHARYCVVCQAARETSS